MTPRTYLTTLALGTLLAAAAGVRAGDGDGAFKSGLQPGESTSAFQCRDITGPKKGTSLCYV